MADEHTFGAEGPFFLVFASHEMNLNVFQTLAYTNKYSLPDESRTREILIRRHASIRRSVRAGSFRELVGGDKKRGGECIFSVLEKQKLA